MEEEGDHEGLDSATTMRSAIYTILVADVVMSIDNVLAVAAIARNDVWLVVFGLLLSIPLIMGGASILLKVIDRFPLIIWVGAALIAYVGFELMFIDPLTRDTVHSLFHEKWIERVVAIAGAVLLTCIAWYFRVHDREGTPPADPTAVESTPAAPDAAPAPDDVEPDVEPDVAPPAQVGSDADDR